MNYTSVDFHIKIMSTGRMFPSLKCTYICVDSVLQSMTSDSIGDGACSTSGSSIVVIGIFQMLEFVLLLFYRGNIPVSNLCLNLDLV